MHLPVLGQLRPHISYSEARLFETCQWKWYLSKVLGQAVDERSLAMEFGSSIHTGMECLYGPRDDGSVPTVEEADAVTLEAFEQNTKGLELSAAESMDLMKLSWLVPRILSDCLSCPDLQGIQPLRTELQILEPLGRTDGLDVLFKGFVDFIFVKKLKRKTVIYIADFKTCVWGWPAKKLMDPKVIAQILLYKHFFCRLTGADPKNVTAAFILLKKAPPQGEPHVEVKKVGGGPKALQEALDWIQSSVTAMHSGHYRMNTDECVRHWTDRTTGLEVEARCPYLRTDLCPSAS